MIHHVSLECQRGDADAHRAFWTALGFAEVTPPAPLRDRAVWFERNGTQIHLLFAETPVVPPDGHVAFQVDDLDALDARARGARAALGRAPRLRPRARRAPRRALRDPARAHSQS